MVSFPETYNDPNARRICSQSHLHDIHEGVGIGDRGKGKNCANYYIMIFVSIGNSMI